MPALIERLTSSGIDFKTQILKFVKDSTTKIIPEIKTTPRAVCHGICIPSTRPKVKYAFSPIPTLIATGVFAHMPFSTVATTVMSAVAVMSASIGMPVLLMIIAFTGTIYIIVKKVVSPALNSVFTLVPFCLSLKKSNSASLVIVNF